MFFQVLFSLAAVWYGVFTITPGFVNNSLKDKVMSQMADGYLLFKWVNSVTNKNDQIISMHRSISLGKSEIISTTFLYYLDFNYNLLHSYHLGGLLNKKHSGSKYILTIRDKNTGIFSNCIDSLYKEKKIAGKRAGRNPFNVSQFYSAYLFKLKDITKSNCLIYIKK